MKKKIVNIRYLYSIVVVFLFCFSITAIANNQIIDRFSGTTSGNSVEIEWSTSTETNVARFELQRQTGNDFKTIHTQIANGRASNYKFTDSDTFFKNGVDEYQSSNASVYRIRIIYSNGILVNSNTITVERKHSSFKRTLGMLKEMFK
jgi:hypothetical protein